MSSFDGTILGPCSTHKRDADTHRLGENLLNADEFGNVSLGSVGSFSPSGDDHSRNSSVNSFGLGTEGTKSTGRLRSRDKATWKRSNGKEVIDGDLQSWPGCFHVSLRTFWLGMFIAANVANFAGKWLSYSAGLFTGVSSGGFALAGTAEQHCVLNGHRFIENITCVEYVAVGAK